MANTKISALTAATTPLAGTEVLPVVQSGVTKQVSVANLTAGRSVSAASLSLTSTPLAVTSGGTGTATAFTAGSVLFAGASGVYSQDNANLFWDAANIRLGIGTASPGTRFDMLGATTTQLRVRMTGQADMRFAADTGTGFLGTSNSFPVSIRTNGTTGIYIDTSQNVSIGGIAPSVRLDINSASTTQLRVQMTGQPDVRLVSDTGYGAVGTYSNSQFLIRTNSTTAATVDTSQNITFNVGNLVIGTAGKGIDFSANSHAAGMTSELLTWYEEGTWTPYILFGGSGTGITYTTQTGRYTRIGRTVYVEGKIVLSNKGTATGTMTLRGLPFNVNADSYPTQTIDTAGGWANLTTGGCLFFVAQQSTDYGYVMVQGTANRGTTDQTYFTNTTDLRFSFTYTV